MAIPVVVHVATERPPTASETLDVISDLLTIHAACVAAVAADSGNPPAAQLYLTRLQIGSIWVELMTDPDTADAAKVAAIFVSAVSTAPWLAALPNRIKESWYRSAEKAERAQRSYERLRAKGRLSAEQTTLDSSHAGTRHRRPGPGQRRTTGTP